MTHNESGNTVSEVTGRIDLQLSELLEMVFNLERDWRLSDRIDSAVRYTR